jgi:glucose-1-phosphate cytidylyltransferase
VKTVILAGGRGTRLAEETDAKPKPMVDIGGRPILWHIMSIYAQYGLTEFFVALGYRADVVRDFFLTYRFLASDITVDLGSGRVVTEGGPAEDWRVHLLDTGVDTQTGGRLKRLAPSIGGERFLMTYGDGVAAIDIRELLMFHQSHGRLATLLAVHPPARFGGLSLDGHIVSEFTEKPQLGDGWINGGFFVLEPEVLDYIDGDETPFEREPLERLAKEGQLAAFRHEGFWQAMDTLRDVRYLNALCAEGELPWLR